MDHLKQGGKVVKVQSIASEKSQISIYNKFRWHMLVGYKWGYLFKVKLPRDEFG